MTDFLTGPRRSRFVPLIYHDIAIGDEEIDRNGIEDRPYVMSPEVFENHLSLLREHRFESVTSRDLVAHLVHGRPLPERSVLISFDDGHASNYLAAVPLLERHGFRGEFLVTTDWIGSRKFLSWEQLRDMRRRGMEIGSHTASHPVPTALSTGELLRELVESKAVLESNLGGRVRSLSSPTGFHDGRMRDLAAEAGYEILFVGVTSLLGRPLARQDAYWIERFDVKSSLGEGTFQAMIGGRGAAFARMRAKEFTLGCVKSAMGPAGYNAFRRFVLGCLR